jgi:thymidylate synthase
MNTTFIEARDLSEAWFQCVCKALTDGYEYKIERGSYAGQQRKELDFVVVQIRYPGTRPLVPDVPQGVPPPSTMDYVEEYLPYLMTAHRKEGEQYTYGQYLEKQIAEVIKMYQEDGYNTNQAFMAVGDAQSIFLSDPPCLRAIDTRIRHNKLNFVVYFRSWDLWAGFPSNLAAIQLLKEYMASEIGVEDGEIIAMSKGLHLYEYSWELAKIAVRMD